MRLTLLAVLALLGVASALLDSLQLDTVQLEPSQLDPSQPDPSQQDCSQLDSSQVVDSNNCSLPVHAENQPVETLLSVLSAMYEHAGPDQKAELEELQKFIASLRTSLQAVAQTIHNIK